MDRAWALREELNALEGQPKVSVNDLVVRACALALMSHPGINASFQGDSIRVHRRAHIGIAVALEDGLITPVLRDCQAKSLAQIAVESRDLTERARGRKLRATELSGATFSVSNLGMYDVTEFSAIINPPEGAILAVGAVRRVPVVDAAGTVGVGRRMMLTLSCDHRAMDGAMGARFLQDLRRLLEEPLRLLVQEPGGISRSARVPRGATSAGGLGGPRWAPHLPSRHGHAHRRRGDPRHRPGRLRGRHPLRAARTLRGRRGGRSPGGSLPELGMHSHEIPPPQRRDRPPLPARLGVRDPGERVRGGLRGGGPTEPARRRPHGQGRGVSLPQEQGRAVLGTGPSGGLHGDRGDDGRWRRAHRGPRRDRGHRLGAQIAPRASPSTRSGCCPRPARSGGSRRRSHS